MRDVLITTFTKFLLFLELSDFQMDGNSGNMQNGKLQKPCSKIIYASRLKCLTCTYVCTHICLYACMFIGTHECLSALGMNESMYVSMHYNVCTHIQELYACIL